MTWCDDKLVDNYNNMKKVGHYSWIWCNDIKNFPSTSPQTNVGKRTACFCNMTK